MRKIRSQKADLCLASLPDGSWVNSLRLAQWNPAQMRLALQITQSIKWSVRSELTSVPFAEISSKVLQPLKTMWVIVIQRTSSVSLTCILEELLLCWELWVRLRNFIKQTLFHAWNKCLKRLQKKPMTTLRSKSMRNNLRIKMRERRKQLSNRMEVDLSNTVPKMVGNHDINESIKDLSAHQMSNIEDLDRSFNSSQLIDNHDRGEYWKCKSCRNINSFDMLKCNGKTHELQLI